MAHTTGIASPQSMHVPKDPQRSERVGRQACYLKLAN